MAVQTRRFQSRKVLCRIMTGVHRADDLWRRPVEARAQRPLNVAQREQLARGDLRAQRRRWVVRGAERQSAPGVMSTEGGTLLLAIAVVNERKVIMYPHERNGEEAQEQEGDARHGDPGGEHTARLSPPYWNRHSLMHGIFHGAMGIGHRAAIFVRSMVQ